MRFESTAKVLLKCKLMYYKISECGLLCYGFQKLQAWDHQKRLIRCHKSHLMMDCDGMLKGLHSPSLPAWKWTTRRRQTHVPWSNTRGAMCPVHLDCDFCKSLKSKNADRKTV